jgi:hypothetical protein
VAQAHPGERREVMDGLVSPRAASSSLRVDLFRYEWCSSSWCDDRAHKRGECCNDANEQKKMCENRCRGIIKC